MALKVSACRSLCPHSKLKVEENGRSAIFHNNGAIKLSVVQVDGCLDFDGLKADYVIERGDAAVVVELKGRDVEHGAKQIFETAKLWKSELKLTGNIAGLLVSRQYPKATTTIQLKQQHFARQFSGPLHVVTKNQDYEFEHVLSFRGPLKA